MAPDTLALGETTFPNGAYPVEWSPHLRKGDNLSYQITSVNVDEFLSFEVSSVIIAIIGKLPDAVDNGYYGNMDCTILYANEEPPFSLIPPLIVPKYVFRACCNAYKPLVYQLQDWGWKNFTLVSETNDTFVLTHSNGAYSSEIIFNYEGIALSFKLIINSNDNYTGELMTQLTPSTSIQSTDLSWGLTGSIICIFLIILKRKNS